MKQIFTFLFALMIFLPLSAQAKTMTGDQIPHDLSVMDQNSTAQSFETLVGEKGAVIVFVRSAEWCPYCKKQLVDIKTRQAEIEEKGYSIIAISYDAVKEQARFTKENTITYTMLSDKNSEIIKAFGILNTEMKEGSKYYGIPHPTIYVVDHNGTIKAVFAEEGYKNRPSLDNVIDTLE